MTDIQKRLLWLVLLIVALIIISAIAWRGQGTQNGIGYFTGTTGTATQNNTPPPYTSDVASKLAASHGFQVLISYTDRGFEPATASLKKGQTVRFTNNSSGVLHVVAPGQVGDVLYPGEATCGGSALNSCADIATKDFWEFTFTAAGTWTYKDSQHPDNRGTVVVK